VVVVRGTRAAVAMQMSTLPRRVVHDHEVYGGSVITTWQAWIGTVRYWMLARDAAEAAAIAEAYRRPGDTEPVRDVTTIDPATHWVEFPCGCCGPDYPLSEILARGQTPKIIQFEDFEVEKP
jgi:hypothetical protein